MIQRDESGIAHIIALSGGKDSTALAFRLNEVEPRPYNYVCTPTGDELPELLDHWDFMGKLLGPITYLHAEHDLDGLIDKWNALPNGRQRWCTRVLKIEPFEKFLSANQPVQVYVGLRADEERRIGAVYKENFPQRFPMRDDWNWYLEDVWAYLTEKNIRIPKRTDCARCFHQRLGEWWTLWNQNSNIYVDAERQEKLTGHTFRRRDRDTWPTSLAGLRDMFEAGHVPEVRQHPQDVTGAVQLDMLKFMDDFEDQRDGACRICTM